MKFLYVLQYNYKIKLKHFETVFVMVRNQNLSILVYNQKNFIARYVFVFILYYVLVYPVKKSRNNIFVF